MDLKILMVILLYYGVLSTVFLMGGAALGDATMTSSIDTNSSLSPGESGTGGLFGSGISFARFAGLITIGVGLPSDTPSWAASLFIIWQTVWLLFTIGFVVSSIWNG